VLGITANKIVLNALYFSGLTAVSKSFTQGIGAIWMLHHVRDHQGQAFDPNAHLTITPDFLASQIEAMQAKGYEFVSLDEAKHRLSAYRNHAGKNPFVTVTLDDGYRDNFNYAVPVFRKYNVPYTIYVAPGLVDGGATLWWEDLEAVIRARDTIYVDLDEGRREFAISTPSEKNRAFEFLANYLATKVDEERHVQIMKDLCAAYSIDQQAHCRDEIMDWAQISELSEDPLCTIGAHTINHVRLSRLSPDEMRYEMEESRRIIEAETGKSPQHLAYPYGMEGAAATREFEAAKEIGFSTAVTTRHGVVYTEHQKHMHALPRISLNGHFQSSFYTSALMSGLPTRLQNWGSRLNVR